MPAIYYIGDIIYFHFTIYDSDGITPLSGEELDDVNYELFLNTTEVAIPPVNFGECGTSGTYYTATYPTTVGTYQLRIRGTNDYYDVWHTNNFLVQEAKSGINVVEKILKNKLTFAQVGGHYYQQVWDDNGTNVYLQWRLYDKDDLDIVLAGRAPVSRGAPSGG
jgi:hypothetical protein